MHNIGTTPFKLSETLGFLWLPAIALLSNCETDRHCGQIDAVHGAWGNASKAVIQKVGRSGKSWWIRPVSQSTRVPAGELLWQRLPCPMHVLQPDAPPAYILPRRGGSIPKVDQGNKRCSGGAR